MLRAVAIRLLLVLLVLNLFTLCESFRASGKSSDKYNNGNKYNPKTPGLPSQNATRRGLGISAWGIVILVVSVIVAGMALYYFSVCYPMCQGYSTSNRYDKMPKIGLPTMA